MRQPHRPVKFDPPWIDFFPSPCPYMTKQYTAFPKFSFLPKELQRTIWSFSIPDPRAIIVDEHIPNDDSDIPRCRTTAVVPVPGILHACYESRVEGLKIFSAAFAKPFDHSIYFNFDLDILVFTSKDARDMFVLKQHFLGGPLSEFSRMKYIGSQQSTRLRSEDYAFFFAWFPKLSHLLMEGWDPLWRIPLPNLLPKPRWPADHNKCYIDNIKRLSASYKHYYKRAYSHYFHAETELTSALPSDWTPPVITSGNHREWANLWAKTEGKMGWTIGKEETWGTVEKATAEEPMDWEPNPPLLSLEYKPL
ncbi:hypothetical protein B0O99DRAFT_736233 [Bisporella sp. PMI_857]|nr:hypothetical protein B0O99DRAFT_736233 [Bisporella sp. PMI_857]